MTKMKKEKVKKLSELLPTFIDDFGADLMEYARQRIVVEKHKSPHYCPRCMRTGRCLNPMICKRPEQTICNDCL